MQDWETIIFITGSAAIYSKQMLTNKSYVYPFNCIIIIIIMTCHRHAYPWPSLATSRYRSLPLVGLQGYIPYPHIAVVCMFELVVLLLPGHMWGSIGVYNLRACPCFSSSVLHLTVCKYIIHSKLLLLHSNKLSHSTFHKQMFTS